MKKSFGLLLLPMIFITLFLTQSFADKSENSTFTTIPSESIFLEHDPLVPLEEEDQKLDELGAHRFTRTLIVGWDPWYPYEYLKYKELNSSLTGIEIELLKLISKYANFRLKFIEQPWSKTLEDLKTGKVDLATASTYSKERAEFARFSIPYRTEEDALYILKQNAARYDFNTVEEFIQFLKTHPFRLGIIAGNIYPNAALNEFIEATKDSSAIVPATTDKENLEKLLNGEIDGFMSDRVSASSLIWQAGKVNKVVERYMGMKAPIHFIFSKATVSIEEVEKFNQAIRELKGTSDYRNIFSWYLYPVIMLQTTHATWFKLLDAFGALFFSISGALIAYTLNHTLLAALIYAFLPSMAGSIIRDVIANEKPIEMLSTPQYMLLVCVTTLIVLCFLHLYHRHIKKLYATQSESTLYKVVGHLNFQVKHALIISDALGLSALSVFGVLTALNIRAEPLWLWGPFFAFLTGAFGTVIRDILSKMEDLEAVTGEIYSEIAIVWGLIFSIALNANVDNIRPELVQGLILMTVSGVFITRLLLYYFKVPNVYFR